MFSFLEIVKIQTFLKTLKTFFFAIKFTVILKIKVSNFTEFAVRFFPAILLNFEY